MKRQLVKFLIKKWFILVSQMNKKEKYDMEVPKDRMKDKYADTLVGGVRNGGRAMASWK